jgi:hypothetical protein
MLLIVILHLLKFVKMYFNGRDILIDIINILTDVMHYVRRNITSDAAVILRHARFNYIGKYTIRHIGDR